MNDHEAFCLNLIGAFALLAGEAVQAATEQATRHGGQAAAALVVIGDQPGLSAEQLRGVLHLSQPGAAHLLNRLVAAGWVDRGPAADARRHALTLTAAGRTVVGELLGARRAALQSLLEPLDPAEREQLAAVAAKLLASHTTNPADLLRLCRLCERPVCDRCPVAAALTA
jgi:DNA-binding MarR family transcriptional regulator